MLLLSMVILICLFYVEKGAHLHRLGIGLLFCLRLPLSAAVKDLYLMLVIIAAYGLDLQASRALVGLQIPGGTLLRPQPEICLNCRAVFDLYAEDSLGYGMWLRFCR